MAVTGTKSSGSDFVGINDALKQTYTGPFSANIEGESEVGGGSFPGARLKTWLVCLTPSTQHLAPNTFAERLREADPPIISRIADDHVVLDPRTIFPDQVEIVARAVRAALAARDE